MTFNIHVASTGSIWKAERWLRITASMAGTTAKWRPSTQVGSTICSMLYSEFTRNQASTMGLEPGESQYWTICTVETTAKVRWHISEHWMWTCYTNCIATHGLLQLLMDLCKIHSFTTTGPSRVSKSIITAEINIYHRVYKVKTNLFIRFFWYINPEKIWYILLPSPSCYVLYQ